MRLQKNAVEVLQVAEDHDCLMEADAQLPPDVTDRTCERAEMFNAWGLWVVAVQGIQFPKRRGAARAIQRLMRVTHVRSGSYPAMINDSPQ